MAKRNDGIARTSAPASPEPKPPRQPTTLPVDDFHGQGGTYVMEGGVRRLVQPPTQNPDGTPDGAA